LRRHKNMKMIQCNFWSELCSKFKKFYFFWNHTKTIFDWNFVLYW